MTNVYMLNEYRIINIYPSVICEIRENLLELLLKY